MIMSGRVIVCGDVHGCIDELKELVALVEYKPGKDRLVFVGDLVDRGPDPRACVRWVMDNGALAVRGNHEDKLVEFCRRSKGRQPKPDRFVEWKSFTQEELEWMDKMPLWLDLGDGWLIVHGGFEPKPLAEQKKDRVIRCRWVDEKTGEYVGLQRVEVPDDYAGEGVVTEGRKHRPHVSGSDSARAHTPEAIARRQERASLRLARGEPASPTPTPARRRRYTTSFAQPPNTVDWQKVWPGPQNVIYGHAAQKNGKVREDYTPVPLTPEESYVCLGVDTGCVFGNCLSAVVLGAGPSWYQTVSVKAKREYFPWPEEGT
jgi:Calcineurin-like phosphoesterase